MVFNPVDHQSNKHVRINCHYTRELTANKIIAPLRVSTEANLADVFTKALAAPTFKRLTSSFMSGKTTACMFSTTPQLTSTILEDSEHDSDSKFRRDWPYVNTVKKEMGADSYELIETEEKFSTGRRKYEVVFFDSNLTVISRHIAMRLLSRSNSPYIVCQRQAKMSSEHGTTMHTTPERDVNRQRKASMSIVAPEPTLTCRGCGVPNTPRHVFLKCTSCQGNSFMWSCGCHSHATPSYSPPPRREPSYSPPPRVQAVTTYTEPTYSPPRNKTVPASAVKREEQQRKHSSGGGVKFSTTSSFPDSCSYFYVACAHVRTPIGT